MKVIFLTAALSRNSGGLFFTISSYTKSLLAKGIDVTIVGYNDSYSVEDRAAFGKVNIITYSISKYPLLSKFGYSSDLLKILKMIDPDIIHLQGLWMYHSWAALRYRKLNHRVKIIIEPHGMLDPWAVNNSAWKKKIVGKLFEYENLRRADVLHALCLSELDSIRKFGLKTSIEIIPNGVDLPDKNSHIYNNLKVLLYIGRIHPKKGLRQLVEAIAIVKNVNPQLLQKWQIKIAGWDQLNHLSEIRALAHSLDIEDCIKFLGPVFGKEKEQLLNESDAFILPSFSEGLPMTILEAWSYKIPTIMTDYCNLPEGFEAGASFRIEPNAQSISDMLMKVFNMSDEELMAMGMSAYTLVASKFTWSAIADQTIKVYNKLLGYN